MDASGRGIRPPEPEVRYPLDLDVGEIAMGYHLIARSITLTEKGLYFEYGFAPELTDEAAAEVFANMSYDADISPANPYYLGLGADEMLYARPPLEARYAWFDFFPPDYMGKAFLDGSSSDSEYLRNRISRLIFDLKTGEARLEV